MNPKQFLQIGGVAFIILAVLGFVGLIGPTAGKSIFGATWFFDNTENWAHLIVGAVALISSVSFPLSIQKPVVILVGVLGITIGAYSIFGPVYSGKMLYGAALQNPTDSILHLVIGVWALIAFFYNSGKKTA